MRIAVDGIPAAGLELELGLRDEWAVEAATLALDGPPSELSGQASVRLASDRGVVHVELDIRAAAERTCDRCGEPAALTVHTSGVLLYAPEERGDDALDGDIELDADDLEVGWYTERALRMADVVREALALEVPARVVCTDTDECDRRTDALLAAAGGTEESGHPGFAALAALRES